eukprot:364440-Chlamydomonas_euryale.AAC.4
MQATTGSQAAPAVARLARPPQQLLNLQRCPSNCCTCKCSAPVGPASAVRSQRMHKSPLNRLKAGKVSSDELRPGVGTSRRLATVPCPSRPPPPSSARLARGAERDPLREKRMGRRRRAAHGTGRAD